jgi:uncharacterized membrane protein
MLHRLWLVLLVVAQLTLLVLTPVEQGNDERGHFIRMWAIADGHFSCQQVPKAVREIDEMRLWRAHLGDYFRRGLAFTGGAERVDGHDYDCYYFPLAVVLPGIASRLVALDWHGQPRRGGVFIGSYVSRLVNLATVDAALIFFLMLVPWGRSTALAFFTIPMVMEQSVCIDHDGVLMGLALLCCAMTFARRDWRGVAVIVASSTAMAVIKPTFIGFGLLALPLVARLPPPVGWAQKLLARGFVVPPIGYAIWSLATDMTHSVWHPGFANPGRQMKFLALHPWKLITITISYLHYLIDDGQRPDFYPHRINGVWTTLFFSNLAFEMAKLGCLLAALSFLLALAGDALAAAPSVVDDETRRLRIARLWAWAGVAASFPLTLVTMYLIFSHVGSDQAFGVVGRYYAPAWIALGLMAVEAYRRRRSARSRGALALSGAAMTAGFGAVSYALAAYWHYYWR